MSEQAFMSSPVSQALVNKVQANLAAIRENPSDKKSGVLLVDIVNQMTEEAMTYYFYEPMDIIEAGTITRKFVSMGVSGSQKMVNTMGKKAVSGLSDKQMLQLCDFIESLIK